jgi:hypothetical protein
MNPATSPVHGKIAEGIPILLAVALVLALAAPAAVTAEEYQFKFFVPVQVKNLHTLAQSVEVACNVKDANGNFILHDVAHSPTDTGALDGTGSFTGTLSTSIKMYNPSDATKAKTYTCALMIRRGWGVAMRPPEYCPDPTFNYYCLKPGTASTLKVEGPIP